MKKKLIFPTSVLHSHILPCNTARNKRGLSTHPCLTPLVIFNFFLVPRHLRLHRTAGIKRIATAIPHGPTFFDQPQLSIMQVNAPGQSPEQSSFSYSPTFGWQGINCDSVFFQFSSRPKAMLFFQRVCFQKQFEAFKPSSARCWTTYCKAIRKYRKQCFTRRANSRKNSLFTFLSNSAVKGIKHDEGTKAHDNRCPPSTRLPCCSSTLSRNPALTWVSRRMRKPPMKQVFGRN